MRALNCGWISCCVAAATSFAPVPDATTRCRFRNALMIFWPGIAVRSGITGQSGAKCAPAPAAISTRRKTGPKRCPPTTQTCIPVPTHKRGAVDQERPEEYAVGHKMLPARMRPGRGKFSSTRSTKGTCEPGREPRELIPWSAQAGVGRQDPCQQGQAGRLARSRHRDRIMRMVTRHRSPSVSEKRGDRLISKRRLRG